MEKQRSVTTEQGADFKQNFKLDFFKETSAKSGTNVSDIFVEAAKILYKDFVDFKDRESSIRTDRETGVKPQNTNIKIPVQRPQRESDCTC